VLFELQFEQRLFCKSRYRYVIFKFIAVPDIVELASLLSSRFPLALSLVETEALIAPTAVEGEYWDANGTEGPVLLPPLLISGATTYSC